MATLGTEYKSKLIDRINSIDDKNVLDEVNRMLEVDIDETVYQTNTEQKKEIAEARLQLSKNKGIPADQADEEIDQWLSK